MVTHHLLLKKIKIFIIFFQVSKNLDLENFNLSDLNIFVERITKDTYLKIFQII